MHAQINQHTAEFYKACWCHASRRVAGQPGGRDVLAHVGVGQGAGEEVHRVVHQGRLGLKQLSESQVLRCESVIVRWGNHET